jgi:hypothetical protein
MPQTAVDFIIRKLNPFVNAMPNDIYSTICNIIIEAKAMEKEQIIDAYCDGSNTRTSGEQYYKEAYAD